MHSKANLQPLPSWPNCGARRSTSFHNRPRFHYLDIVRPRRRRRPLQLQPSLANLTLTTILLTLAQICMTLGQQIQPPLQPVDQKCQSTGSFMCNIDNYNTVQPFKNTLGHQDLDAARADLHQYGFLMTRCKSKTQLFLCSLYFPVCVSPSDVATKLLLPCRDICEEALTCSHKLQEVNMTWPREWNCDNFEYFRNNKMCVINNQKDPLAPTAWNDNGIEPASDLPSAAQPVSGLHRDQPPAVPMAPLLGGPTTETVFNCDPGFFNCKLSDPKRPLCIEQKYVCDGKKDCSRNDSSFDENEGRDETVCNDRCGEGELNCDGRCISSLDICDGKTDCSSGIDEQNCHIHPISVYDFITSILVPLILVTSLMISLILYYTCKGKSSSSQLGDPSKDRPFVPHTNLESGMQIHETPSSSCPESLNEPTYQDPSCLYNQPVGDTHFGERLYQRPARNYMDEPTYHTDSILERDYYEDCILGASGASSDYGGGSTYIAPTPTPKKKVSEPVAPPPTPIPVGHFY